MDELCFRGGADGPPELVGSEGSCCDRVAVFPADANGTDAYGRFVSPRAQALSRSAVLRDC